MRSSTVRRLGAALFLVGLVATAFSVYSGLIRFYLVVIIPVLTSESALGLLPLLALFAGFVLMAVGPAFGDDFEDDYGNEEPATVDQQGAEGRSKVGGVVLIGPIPIVFGSDKNTALIAAAAAIIILAIMVLLLL